MQEHAANLRSIGYFAAPYGKTVTPVTIPPETELVELICDGKIFFEIEGTRRTFGKGAMFWHVSGEKTIWDTPAEDPYRCFVFVFETHPPKRIVPRVSIWDSPDEAVDFSARMFKIFHEKEFDPEFRQYILDFEKDQLPRINELIKQYKDSKVITIFHSREEADNWINGQASAR